MPVRSFLLRILLSLALVLNGVGAAHASAGMDAVRAGTLASAAAAATPAMPCDGDGHAATGAHDPAVPVAHCADDGAASTTDCCESGSCHCICVQAAQTVAPGLVLSAPVPADGRHARPRSRLHAEPAPLHPIRPPIG